MKTHRLLLALVPLGLLFLAVLAGAVSAQESTPTDDEVNAIARELFCPVCENTPLDVCPTEACRQWRDLIRQMLAEGRTADEIQQYFVENYGARVLSEPPRSGLNWLAYLVPPLAFALGVFLLLRAFRMWRRQAGLAASAQASPPATPERDAYVERLEAELKKRKKA